MARLVTCRHCFCRSCLPAPDPDAARTREDAASATLVQRLLGHLRALLLHVGRPHGVAHHTSAICRNKVGAPRDLTQPPNPGPALYRPESPEPSNISSTHLVPPRLFVVLIPLCLLSRPHLIHPPSLAPPHLAISRPPSLSALCYNRLLCRSQDAQT